MSERPGGKRLGFGWFALVILLAGAALAGIGYFPTLRLAGAEALPALLAGCAIAVVGSWIGAVPLVISSPAPANVLTVVMTGTALRLLVVVMLSVAAGLSGFFPTAPLLVWVAIGYLGLLVPDTIFAVRVARDAAAPRDGQ